MGDPSDPVAGTWDQSLQRGKPTSRLRTQTSVSREALRLVG